MKVNRGLFGTESAGARRLKASPSDAIIERVFERLRATEAAPNLSVWKEKEEWARMLYRLDHDFYGRRLRSATSQGALAARYIARVSHRARAGALPSGCGWAYLRSAIAKVYKELEGSQ